MAAPATRSEILDVNRRYHDVAAEEYDAKWGVDFGGVGRAQVLGKVEKLLGRRPGGRRRRPGTFPTPRAAGDAAADGLAPMPAGRPTPGAGHDAGM